MLARRTSLVIHAGFVGAAFWALARTALEHPVTTSDIAWLSMAASLLLYAFGHALRYARLLVLLMEIRPAYSAVFSAHFVSAWVGAALPFRLGEPYRVYRISLVAGSWRHGLAAFAVEKFFDAVILAIVVSITLAIVGATLTTVVLLLVLSTVVAGAVATYLLASGSISYAARLLLTDGRAEVSLWLLHAASQARAMHDAARRTVQQRALPLLGLTAAIWATDFMAFFALARGLRLTDPDLWAGFLGALEGTLGRSGISVAPGYMLVVLGTLSIAALAGISLDVLGSRGSKSLLGRTDQYRLNSLR